MSSEMIFAVTGVLLFAIGAAGTILLAEPLRRVLAFNIMGSGACVVLVSLAQRNGIADPVPQAMVRSSQTLPRSPRLAPGLLESTLTFSESRRAESRST